LFLTFLTLPHLLIVLNSLCLLSPSPFLSTRFWISHHAVVPSHSLSFSQPFPLHYVDVSTRCQPFTFHSEIRNSTIITNQTNCVNEWSEYFGRSRGHYQMTDVDILSHDPNHVTRGRVGLVRAHLYLMRVYPWMFIVPVLLKVLDFTF